MLEVTVGQEESSAKLCGALLIYSDRRAPHCEPTASYATVHSVEDIKGQPEIMPGRLLTLDDLAKLTLSLSITDAAKVQDMQWFEGSILAKGKDRLVWWTPPGSQSMFFDEDGEQGLKGRGFAPVPGLVWVAMPGKSLFVYAVKGSTRPTQESPVFQAPFFNVWSCGQVCIGSAETPTEEKTWDAKAWERMFFGSRFTHPNFREKNRLTKGIDPSKFWRSMLAEKPRNFPQKRLVAIPMSVGDLLDPLFIDKAKKLPRAEGEF